LKMSALTQKSEGYEGKVWVGGHLAVVAVAVTALARGIDGDACSGRRTPAAALPSIGENTRWWVEGTGGHRQRGTRLAHVGLRARDGERARAHRLHVD
jgi:hypothetical protein